MTPRPLALERCPDCGGVVSGLVPLGRHAVVWRVVDGVAVLVNCIGRQTTKEATHGSEDESEGEAGDEVGEDVEDGAEGGASEDGEEVAPR